MPVHVRNNPAAGAAGVYKTTGVVSRHTLAAGAVLNVELQPVLSFIVLRMHTNCDCYAGA